MNNLITVLKGSSGSGDFGHVGRAGKRGGSGGGGGKGKPRKGRRSREALDKEIAERKKPKVVNDFRTSNTDANIQKLDKRMNEFNSGASTPNEDVISNIAKNSGVDEDIVRDYILSWNNGSNAERYKVAKSAQRTLGAKLSPYDEDNKDDWSDRIDMSANNKSNYDKITKTIYDDTQKQLKELGSSEVLLHRGIQLDNDVNINEGDITKWHGNSLDSWTTDAQIAEQFGFTIIRSSIPASRIFSMPSSGNGASDEREMVVIGNGPTSDVFVSSHSEF